MKRTTFLPLALTVLLLAGCTGAPITREEAVARAEAIEEHYDSDDFSFPTKFSITQETRINSASSQTEISIDMLITLDLEGKYCYQSADASSNGESEYSKIWIYYQASDDKTYMVIDENGTKGRAEIAGDMFISSLSGAEDALEDIYSSLSISALLNYASDEETRNVYHSSGEGSIYLKIYIDTLGENGYGEINISNYLILMAKTYVDGENYMEYSFKYNGITTSKPNLANYPLVD